MISVQQALDNILDLVQLQNVESVGLCHAAGRVLAEPVKATRDQPPYATSAMDGYAVASSDVLPGKRLAVIGESSAGTSFSKRVRPGSAVRIFTGAALPAGSDRVVIQEDVEADADWITIRERFDSNPYIRRAAGDYRRGMRLDAPRLLHPSTLALIASMNVPRVRVFRSPDVAIVPTGDELAMPGDAVGEQEIIASSGFGIAAILEAHGASARLMPIARDRIESIEASFGLAAEADLIVTVGGASEGDYDLIRPAAERLGLRQSFYKLAMRPGKPLMAGSLNGRPVVGLPGNPVSAMVCAHVFLVPAVRAMLGLGRTALSRRRAPLAAPVSANGAREHYMRAVFDRSRSSPRLKVLERQDSSLMSVLEQADALVVRPPFDPARKEGDFVDYCNLRIQGLDTNYEPI